MGDVDRNVSYPDPLACITDRKVLRMLCSVRHFQNIFKCIHR